MPLEADVRAIQSWDANQEPWHLEPPSDGASEYQREQDWTYLMGDIREFVGRYGLRDLFRCIAEAVGK